MNEVLKHITVVIPSLEPKMELVRYILQLIERGVKDIVVVNDGSDSTFDPIFTKIRELDVCEVLVHKENYGKGTALKTAYRYIQEYRTNTQGIITVDSDGQHTVDDVCKVAETLSIHWDSLVLGGRSFKSSEIPFKSKIGNRSTSCLFYLLYGKWFEDTQTGLRGFGIQLLDDMLRIEGERFEYEMQVLIQCIVRKIPITTVLIETIYDNNNEGTHFQVMRDSVRIMKVLFGNFVKFCCSSLMGAVTDIATAWFLLDFLKPYFLNNDFVRIGLAVSGARVLSICVNYTINRKVVFKESASSKRTLIKYLCLCIIIMCASVVLVYLGHSVVGMSDKVAKVMADIVLFGVSYEVQRRWVFR